MKIQYPIKTINISQPFGFDNTRHKDRSDFYKIFDNKHPGIDFDLSVGSDIYASFKGIVVRKEFHKGMGNVVAIRNGNIVALYAHLSNITVELGSIVIAGELIGLSGYTGDACLQPHLHFELRDISKPTLKDTVFEPNFDQDISSYATTFVYTVNNKNTSKTLKGLSKLYFGTENNWGVIKVLNNLTKDSDETIKENTKLIIPNFE